MSDPVECHMLTPLRVVRRYLRRYRNHEEGQLERVLRKKAGLGQAQCCGPYGYCTTQVFLDEIDYEPKTVIKAAPDWPRDDPRWPSACEYCGKHFKDTDNWQVFQDALYQRFDGEIIALRDAKPGDLWDAWWYPDDWKTSADGMCLVLKMPRNHEWLIDRPGHDNTHWVRTGVPPKITVTPSVLVPSDGYHAWLRDGFLVEC